MQDRTAQRRAAALGGLSPIADSCNHIYEDAELSRASKSYSCSLHRQCRGVSLLSTHDAPRLLSYHKPTDVD